MSREDRECLADILAAIDAIRAHLRRGDLSDGLVFDAVRVRLIEIGEAVKGTSAGLLTSERIVPWSQVAGMRDHLAHRYFDTAHSIVEASVTEDLPQLEDAACRPERRATGTIPKQPSTSMPSPGKAQARFE